MNFEKVQSDFINFDKIVEKAESSIQNDRINEDDFITLYGEETLSKDKDLLEKLETKFEKEANQKEKEAKKLALVFEAILSEQAELSDWLGGYVTTINASKYDDLVNGVDMVAEFEKESGNISHMGLAIDATYSSDVSKKFKRIKENIDKGSLATIKYFSSSDNSFTGRLEQVPRVVIGADTETIKELIGLWANGKKKELGEHPIQFQILDLILGQLETFKNYAEKIDNQKLVNRFNHFINIIMDIYDDRKKIIGDSGVRDSMFKNILEQMDGLIK